MRSNRALSNMGVFLIILIAGALLFWIAPKYLGKSSNSSKSSSSSSQTSSEDKSSPGGYVGAYQKGTTKAQAAVDASKDRYSSGQ